MATEPRRKIAHLTTVDLSLRYLLLAQIEASLAAGDEVIGISARGPDVPFLEDRGMRFVELEGSTRARDLRSDLRSARSLWRILKAERPDVLHTHTPKPGIYGRILGRLAGVPRVVHTTHGLYATPEDKLLKRLAVCAVEAIASRFSHVELVQNPEDLELLRRWRIAPRPKLRLLGNGVDLERFRPATEEARSIARRNLGVAPDEIVVGLVARLVEEKGVPELIEAMDEVGPPFRLLLIGPHEPEKADAVSPDVLERAREAAALVLGHRDDVHRLYGVMDVYCLPSHREGFPRSAMEAAACGLPLVATDIRGCRQVIDEGRTGFLVPLRDPQRLAAAVRELGSEERRRQMGWAGRRKAEAEFDERAVVERVLAAYATNP